MESTANAHTRSLYRRLLRELPPTVTAGKHTQGTNSLRNSVRAQFRNGQSATNDSPEYALARRQEVEQAIQYLKAQRVYGALLARYNPGMDMEEDERVRLTARRVGMDMPEEWYGKGKAGKFGIEFEGKKKE